MCEEIRQTSHLFHLEKDKILTIVFGRRFANAFSHKHWFLFLGAWFFSRDVWNKMYRTISPYCPLPAFKGNINVGAIKVMFSFYPRLNWIYWEITFIQIALCASRKMWRKKKVHEILKIKEISQVQLLLTCCSKVWKCSLNLCLTKVA